MHDYFTYRSHLCIVYELLGPSLFDRLRERNYHGFSYLTTRFFTQQLLTAMAFYKAQSIVHCDLKPENVLFTLQSPTAIKLIDFGSACFSGHQIYQYIQSRFYRAPEIMLGIPYDFLIACWIDTTMASTCGPSAASPSNSWPACPYFQAIRSMTCSRCLSKYSGTFLFALIF